MVRRQKRKFNLLSLILRRFDGIDRNLPRMLKVVPLMIGILATSDSFADKRYNSPFDGIIESVALKYGLPKALIHSIILAESNYDPNAISSKGAVGLMQLMPETAKQYGVKDRFNPAANIEGGVKYLKDLIKLYESKMDVVLAAYNAGQETVKKYGGIPPYRETMIYIDKVKSSFEKKARYKDRRIYKFIDNKGRIVLTNDYNLYLRNRPDLLTKK